MCDETLCEAGYDAAYDAAQTSKAWPFEEARRLVARVQKSGQREVVFETGYGPSGLPHIGTFGEVARTLMVRHAFRLLTHDKIPTRLITFSDDMDGLRKVPDNIPNRERTAQHLGKPLSEVPDPFEQYESFAAHNNAMLRRFLDRFGFEYEFASSTAYYRAGRFDDALLHMLRHYDRIQEIMLPSLREERAATYSPFLPIHPVTRIVSQVPLLGVDVERGLIQWRDEAGQLFETPVTGGHVKLQWKPDWAMRWYALKIDYEMAGKDLIDSVKLSTRIVNALGAPPPETFIYELFLDEKGQKISKSKGNGLTIDEWLTYASPESLALFMYQRPNAAKRLHFDAIPRAVDEYQSFLAAYPRQESREQLGNPVWHIHTGRPPAPEEAVEGISFAMLLNLAGVANSDRPEVLWGFLRRYAPHTSPQTHPQLDRLVHYACAYFRDCVAPQKVYRQADEVERAALQQIAQALSILPEDASAESIQTALYDVARPIPRYQAGGVVDGKPGVSSAFFAMLYAVLLGEERGPRLGSFIKLYGLTETQALIARALNGELGG